MIQWLGHANLWSAIAADMGVSLAVVFNALRLLDAGSKSSQSVTTATVIGSFQRFYCDNSQHRSTSTTTTCCTPRGRISYAASDHRRKRPRATRERSNWSPMTASADSSNDDCAKCRRPDGHAPKSVSCFPRLLSQELGPTVVILSIAKVMVHVVGQTDGLSRSQPIHVRRSRKHNSESDQPQSCHK